MAWVHTVVLVYSVWTLFPLLLWALATLNHAWSRMAWAHTVVLVYSVWALFLLSLWALGTF